MYPKILVAVLLIVFFPAMVALVKANLDPQIPKNRIGRQIQKLTLRLLTIGAHIALNGLVVLYLLQSDVKISILRFQNRILRLKLRRLRFQNRILRLKLRYLRFQNRILRLKLRYLRFQNRILLLKLRDALLQNRILLLKRRHFLFQLRDALPQNGGKREIFQNVDDSAHAVLFPKEVRTI